MSVDLYDAGNGTLTASWMAFGGPSVTSYNAYVNGVFNQNVTIKHAVITGLTETAYSASAVAPTPNNSTRPRNMPPNGLVTDSGTYVITVNSVVAGVETSQARSGTIRMSPRSIMLITPMKRLWPFPNTGLD